MYGWMYGCMVVCMNECVMSVCLHHPSLESISLTFECLFIFVQFHCSDVLNVLMGKSTRMSKSVESVGIYLVLRLYSVFSSQIHCTLNGSMSPNQERKEKKKNIRSRLCQ